MEAGQGNSVCKVVVILCRFVWHHTLLGCARFIFKLVLTISLTLWLKTWLAVPGFQLTLVFEITIIQIFFNTKPRVI